MIVIFRNRINEINDDICMIYIYNYHINDINKACYENYNDCFYIFSNQLDKIIRINLFIKIF